MGVAAHALDELNGRPLRTRSRTGCSSRSRVVSLAGALAIGVCGGVAWGYGLLAFVAVGAFLVPAYNLEWFGGRFHNDWWFALAWGAFPALTGFFVEAQTLRLEAVLAAALRDRAEPGAAAALDSGPPMPGRDARRHDERDGAAGARAAHRCTWAAVAARLRARGGAPNLEP